MKTIKAELFGHTFDLTISGSEYADRLNITPDGIEIENDELSEGTINRIQDEVTWQIRDQSGDVYRYIMDFARDYGYKEIRLF